MDLRKIADELSDLLTDYVQNFITLIIRPNKTIKFFLIGRLFDESEDIRKEKFNLKKTFSYTLISIAVGISLANFLNLPNTPGYTDIGAFIAVLFVWILLAMILHPLIKLIKGRGNIKETIMVFLLIVSTLHIIWIPIVAIASKAMTQTRVFLTYNYIISFSGSNREQDFYAFKTIFHPNYVESYIKGEQGFEDGLVLTPVDTTGISPFMNRTTGTIRLSRDSLGSSLSRRLSSSMINSLERKRVPVDSVIAQPPVKTEKKELKHGSFGWVTIISIIYFISVCIYLAIGLSVVHHIAFPKLLILAFLIPLLAMLSIIILLVGYVLLKN